MNDIFRYIDENEGKYLEQLFTLLEQPSISTQDLGMNECAQLLLEMLREAGAEARIFQTARHPVVLGDVRNPLAQQSLLIYGHYDVQPPDPVDLWISPPFEPTIREDRIYGRGTADNKGQLFAHIKAVEAVLRVLGDIPVNIIFLFEGEEEIGSPNLQPFIEGHKHLLKADGCLVSDGPKHDSGRPTIVCGLKGILYLELRAKGAERDLHSMQAAMVPNPAWKLVHALSSLKTQDGRVAIPGFYDPIKKPTEAELEAVSRIPPLAVGVQRQLGIEGDSEETDSYYYNMFFTPTCNISGISSGYTGPGAKTVLPREASVKIDIRLVPDQRPDEILLQMRRHLERQGFGDVDIILHSELMPSRTVVEHPHIRLIAEATRYVTNKEPIIFPSMGGSGPDYLFTGVLGVPSACLPLGSHDSNNHAPNENIIAEDLFEGIKIGATIIEWMGRR
jgi:acetylornithine deacetylase/succinyl-diaminopimelate desuccinylase-like protein